MLINNSCQMFLTSGATIYILKNVYQIFYYTKYGAQVKG